MTSDKKQNRTGIRRFIKGSILFPGLVLVLYGVLLLAAPEEAWLAFKSSMTILQGLLLPLCLVLILIFLINLFLNPAKVAKYLGRTSGLKGIALSAAAGIISAGPIYAWYPLLKDLKEKGASDSSISIFLYNRAVKPILLPIMIAYFGLPFVVVLTVLMLAASMVIGYAITIFGASDVS